MEETSYLRVLFALIFVFALIALLGWGLRRWQAAHGGLAKSANGERRLQMVEQFYFEPKRRLVLMRCDDQEHLIMLGHQGETHISSWKIADSKTGESKT